MAVAWSKSGIGQASKDVVIRDPVVITAGQPRFMAAGDQAMIRLDIHNTDGPAGDYEVAIATDGAASFDFAAAPESVTLGETGRAALTLPVTALSTGDATITVSLSHPDGPTVERTPYLPVRQPAMPMTTRQIVSVPAGCSLRIDE